MTLRLASTLIAAALLSGCVAAPPPVGAPGATGSVVQASGYGYQCFAGFYQCRLPQQVPVGSPCSCPGLGAPSYGSVR